MTLTLNLSPELEQFLSQEAEQHGLSVEDLVVQILADYIQRKQKQIEAVKLIQSWIDDDGEEQEETGEYLIQALDDDRLSDRKLFPATNKQLRPFGLCAGEFTVPDDFDAPLDGNSIA